MFVEKGVGARSGSRRRTAECARTSCTWPRQLGVTSTPAAWTMLTLTTNGSQLARFAPELFDCGVRRINVSIDTLDPDKFRKITRWGDLDKVA